MTLRHSKAWPLSRRQFLLGTAGLGAGLALPWALHATSRTTTGYRLSLIDATAPLLGPGQREVPVWTYNSTVPGPVLRVRQGERLRVEVENRLKQATTVHWHGLRVPNHQDGVPHLTQHPIEPGARYTYEFACPDAGTFWYHPHHRSHEQVGRGLYGPLIVEEREPIEVDRDLIWVLDDWRMTRDGELAENFGNHHDIAHGGRIGNTVTVNGQRPADLRLRAGERIRLRLINGANGRIFALDFSGHQPRVIAYDGQPVTPHTPLDGRVVLGPAMRVDVVLDAVGEPGRHYPVQDTFYEGMEYPLLDLAYDQAPLREQPLDTPIALPPNPLPEPDLERAERHEIRFQGGMMGELLGATLHGQPVNMMRMHHTGKAWAVNGVVADGHMLDPVLTLQRDGHYRIALHNDTAWHHPIHFHGHSFRVISRNATPTPLREWQDTVLMAPRERVEIAFVADNPGDWMFHCHILEHQLGGMMAVIRVA